MDIIPYCGPAPVPASLWSQWNLDPWLLLALAAGMLVHAAALLREQPRRSRNGSAAPCPADEARASTAKSDPAWFRRAGLAAAGWAVLLIAFVSPLCALSTALFSARVVHHALMVALAAPLLVLGLPRAWRGAAATGAMATLALLVHTLLMWLWHAPAPYAAALASHPLYWLMETTLMASALAVWLVALSPRAGLGTAMSTLLGAMMQMGLLGAIIVFAATPLYAPHALTTTAFGLSPLADQQLAGLIMWVPAALPYFIAALWLAGQRLRAAADEDILRAR